MEHLRIKQNALVYRTTQPAQPKPCTQRTLRREGPGNHLQLDVNAECTAHRDGRLCYGRRDRRPGLRRTDGIKIRCSCPHRSQACTYTFPSLSRRRAAIAAPAQDTIRRRALTSKIRTAVTARCFHLPSESYWGQGPSGIRASPRRRLGTGQIITADLPSRARCTATHQTHSHRQRVLHFTSTALRLGKALYNPRNIGGTPHPVHTAQGRGATGTHRPAAAPSGP